MKRPKQSRNMRATKSEDSSPFVHEHKRPPIIRTLRPKTKNQALYLNLIKASTVTFGVGPAGTGKTFLASFLAAEAYEAGHIERIIVTRPVVEAGESIGFLPGEMEEKIDPYFAPVREALEMRLGRSQFEYMLKSRQCEFVPLAFMRGRTFRDAWVIADEMQNSTPKQMKMFLTRTGEGAKVIVNGDLNQSDIPGLNGLADAIERFDGYPGVATCAFTRADVVRSGIARVILDAYEGDQDIPLPPLLLRMNADIDGAIADG